MRWHIPFRARFSMRREGFSISEVMISSTLFLIVMAGALGIFAWVLIRATWVQHVAWSYSEARRSSRDIVDYLRNAAAVTQLDTNNYQWVEFRMANGSLTKFVVVDPPGNLPRDNYMYMSNSLTGKSMIIARGLTGLMTSTGFSRPIFYVQPDQHTIRIGFRVTEPVPSGQSAIDDSRIAAIIDTGVTLRNFTATP